MAALTIYYAGVDITDYVRQETLRIESSGSALAAICRLVVEDRLGQEPWFNPADKSELIIYDGVTRIFGGPANIVDAQHDGPFRGFPIRASDYTVQLEEHIVVDTYTAAGTSDQALIQEMFANWCVPIDATVHVQVVRAAMPEMHFHSILIRQAMDNICRKSGGMYYVDFDRRLHYFLADEGLPAPDILSTEPDEVTRWPYQLRRRRFDASKLCNNILVIGNGIEAWREHAASIAHYDFRYQDTLQDGNVDTVEEAEYLGDWFLARHAWPNETLEVTCWRPNLRAGQNIRLINSVLGIDQFYSIRKASITCTGAYEPDSPQFIVRLTLGLQDAPGRPDFEPPPHEPLPPPVPPPPVPPPDAGWRKEVWAATKALGPFHTPDFVADTRYAHGVPTWTAYNTGLTLVGEDCLGFRGDPFSVAYRQYIEMTDGVYRKEGAGNWVSVLTVAQATAVCGGDDAASSWFAPNGLATNINREGWVGVLFVVARLSDGWTKACLCYSDDFGATWSAADIRPWTVIATLYSLTVGGYQGSSPYGAGQVMYCGRSGAAFPHRIMVSVDGGITWANGALTGPTVFYQCDILVDPSDQSRVFVGWWWIGGDFVGVSLDHGATMARYDTNAPSGELGARQPSTWHHLSVAMDSYKTVRVGAAGFPNPIHHIHTTRDDGNSWEETTPEHSPDQLGLSIVQDAPDFLYLFCQAGTVIGDPHLIWASENEGRDMIRKSGANANIAGTGGGDSIPFDCGGIRGFLPIWTDRAEGDVPGVPVDHDIGRHRGDLAYPQLDALVGTGPGTVASGSHGAEHENGGAMEIDVAGLSGDLADEQDPKAHDHQGIGSDGGKLTGAIVDSYEDFQEIAAPANPGVNVARVYSKDDAGTTKFYYRRSDGTEIELGVAAGALPAHDHQGIGADGGKLTGAIVDSFEDFEEIGAPANPGANVARVYSRDDAGTTKLYYRRSDGTELELGGPGGAGISIWMPDAEPAVPSALDDEFDDSAFDLVLWTEFDPGAVLTVSEGAAGLYLDMASAAGTRLSGIYQAIPGGDFTIWAKVSLSAIMANSGRVALALWDDATNLAAGLYTHTLNIIAADEGVNLYRWTNHGAFHSTIAGRSVKGQTHVYLRIRRTGTTYGFDISSNGLGWERIHSGALVFVPDHFGIIIDNSATGGALRGIGSFYRYKNSDVGITGIMEGRRIDL